MGRRGERREGGRGEGRGKGGGEREGGRGEGRGGIKNELVVVI